MASLGSVFRSVVLAVLMPGLPPGVGAVGGAARLGTGFVTPAALCSRASCSSARSSSSSARPRHRGAGPAAARGVHGQHAVAGRRGLSRRHRSSAPATGAEHARERSRAPPSARGRGPSATSGCRRPPPPSSSSSTTSFARAYRAPSGTARGRQTSSSRPRLLLPLGHGAGVNLGGRASPGRLAVDGRPYLAPSAEPSTVASIGGGVGGHQRLGRAQPGVRDRCGHAVRRS